MIDHYEYLIYMSIIIPYKTTDSETYFILGHLYPPIFACGSLLKAGTFPNIVKKKAVFQVQIRGWAFIRAWTFIRIFMALCVQTAKAA